MKSVIIGGTSNLGRCIAEKLEKFGSDIVTISRSEKGIYDNSNHFQCDVGDCDTLVSILHQIKEKNYNIDNLWCVAGYAYPHNIENQTPEVMKEHIDRNLTYVKIAIDILTENLVRAEDPLLVTLGSQWSYKSPQECPELIPYANAKNALMRYTAEFALTTPEIRANHYCIPSSNTFAFRRIEKTLKELSNKELSINYGYLANPETVTNALVEHALKFRRTGKTLVIQPNGLIELLE